MSTNGRFELILRGGLVVDGTGRAPARADLAISGDRIAAIGEIPDDLGARVISVSGRIVAPGFIDVHAHDDRALLSTPDMTPKVSQGVTTVVVGNCGVSLAPLSIDIEPPPPLDILGARSDYRFATFGAYLDALDEEPAAVNAACLIGHSTLRVGAMARLDQPATAGEIRIMRARLEEGLDAGVIGLSTGLDYPPAWDAPPSELLALAEVLRPRGALYTTHMRDEGEQVLESLEESFALGRAAGVPVIISHHKVSGRANFGRSVETLPRIRAAMAMQRVGLDAYPYAASSTMLRAEWVHLALKVLITWSKRAPEQVGRSLAEIAAEWGVSPEEAATRLEPAGAIYFTMDEADVRRILSFEHTMIGSDGLPHDTHPHPRLWGTFPRVLGHYCRDVGLMSLEEGVRRMTNLPAQTFGLTRRGRIAEGWFADLVVFDPESISDRATFEEPTRPARGIDLVMVNGRAVMRSGTATGDRPGRVLRRQAS